MDRDDEVQAGEDRRKAGDRDRDHGGDDISVARFAAERRVKRPAGVDAAAEDDPQDHGGAGHVDVPTRQVQSRERQIASADHQRQAEIAEHRGNDRHQKEKHHDDAVGGEHFVVGIGRHQRAGGRQQMEADQRGGQTADQEHAGDRNKIEQRDPFVIGREQPRLRTVGGVEIIRAGSVGGCRLRLRPKGCGDRAHGDFGRWVRLVFATAEAWLLHFAAAFAPGQAT